MTTAHFAWGDQPMTWLRYMSIKSFALHNPEWDIIIHTFPVNEELSWITPERLEFGVYEGKDYRERIDFATWEQHPNRGLTPNKCADLIRWEVLAERGGLFCDADVVFVNPMSTHPYITGNALMVTNNIFRLPVISAVAGYKLFTDILAIANDSIEVSGYQSIGVEPIYMLAKNDRVCDPETPSEQMLRDKGYEFTTIPEWITHTFSPEVMTIDRGGPRSDILGFHWSGGHGAGHANSMTMTPENIHTYGGHLPLALIRLGEME